MRAGAGVLDDYRFQAEALATAVLHTNIQSSSTLDDLSPHVLLFQKQPPLDFLKPWSCLVYVNLRKEQRSGADPHCQSAMLVGYVTGSTSVYKCLDMMTPLRASRHCLDVRLNGGQFDGQSNTMASKSTHHCSFAGIVEFAELLRCSETPFLILCLLQANFPFAYSRSSLSLLYITTP